MARQNNFFPDASASFPYFYNGNGNFDNQYPAYVYGSYAENSDRFHWGYFGEEQQTQASSSSSPGSSVSTIEEPSNAGSSPEPSDSKKKKKGKKYDTWSQAEQRLLVQLWAENHELLESREARTAWRKICDEMNARMETSKTVEKCIKKIKYLIDRYKEAKEWNRKQSGGSKKQSLFYEEIDAVLGCRDIVTLSHVSEAGTTHTASSSPISLETSASSPASDDQSGKLKEDAGERKKKEVRSDRKKSTKKRSRADLEEEAEEERREFRESMDTFKKCGENLNTFMANFSQTQQQQMAMMGQFIGAMTQFMSKNSEQ